LCRDWTGASETTPAHFLSARIAESVRNQDPNLPSDSTIVRELDRRYPGQAILVLDQFEELIRDDATFTTGLFAALEFINQQTTIKLVVSLRSEHLHELRPLEHLVQPMYLSRYHLDEIKERYAEDVIAAGNVVAKGSVDDEVIPFVADLW
jgi:hypothetical protein